jgi:hypothetical protein
MPVLSTNEKMERVVANFSKLSDQECAFIIRKNILEALETDTSFEWELVSKFISIGYEMREQLCHLFDNALSQNEQRISGITIRDWLKRYFFRFPLETINLNTCFEFVARSPETRTLNEKDKIRLLKIFRIRDYLFISPIFDMEDKAISSILRFPIRLSQSLGEIWNEMQSIETENIIATTQTISEKLAIKEALRKFGKIGEQIVTVNSIKLKQFDQPVRPSVRNWIYDYTSQLGQTGHSSMDRTNYIFRSENGKNLSSPEREKLAIILKSFDENTPLPIDGEKQEIVFESFARKEAPSRNFFPPQPRPAASINFVHRIEKPSAPSLPTQRPAIATSRNFPPAQNERPNFVRPYSQPTMKPAPLAPPKREVFPPTPELPPVKEMEFTNPYPRPETHETPFEKVAENISNVRYSEGAPQNSLASISQVSAKKIPPARLPSSPAVPAKPLDPVKRPTPAQTTPIGPAYPPAAPNRNIFRPHFGRMTGEKSPEPRIDGNIVDLKGDK